MAHGTHTATPLYFLTDRTRFEHGTGQCPRKRYLGNHAGPTGTGWTARPLSIPLASGILIHRIIEVLLRRTRERDALPEVDTVRATIAEHTAKYEAECAEKGFRGILGSDTTEEVIKEQSTLMAGLAWVFWLEFLPSFLDQYRLVEIEREHLHFLRCTCGADPLLPDEHTRRGCQDIALMLRVDCLAERRVGGGLAYVDFKSTGSDSQSFAEKWETRPQLALGCLDAAARWHREVNEIYVVGFSKGSRKRDRYEEGGPKRQQSPLCYWYRRPANPPLATEDWLPAYEWIDESGLPKRASRAHRRTGIWEMATGDWPTWQAYAAHDHALTPAEYCARSLPASLREKVCFRLGPLNRQDAQLQSLRRAITGEEARWREVLWDLYDRQLPWPHPEFQAALDDLVPQSWNCRPYGADHGCEFIPICFRHDCWTDPVGSGKYLVRLPHHQPERDQASLRGLLPEQAAEVDEEEA